MLIKGIFQWWGKSHHQGQKQQIKQLKTKVQLLENQVGQLAEQLQQEQELKSPIVVEKIIVDKVILDKVELNNNFGALSVKELSGRLNIGANYGMAGPPYPLEQSGYEELKKQMKAEAGQKEQNESKQQGEKATRQQAETAGGKAKKTAPKCVINYAVSEADR